MRIGDRGLFARSDNSYAPKTVGRFKEAIMKTKLTSMKTQITSMKKHMLRTGVVALLAAIAFMATGPANAQLINGSFIKGCNLAWEDGAYNTWLGLDPTEPRPKTSEC